MKKNHLLKFQILFILLYISSVSNGQNQLPVDYFIVGGNVPNTTARLGTINCKDVVITAENRDLVTITCGGLTRFGGSTSSIDTNNAIVAIGTGTYGSRLSVAGFENTTNSVIYSKVLYKGPSNVSAIDAFSYPGNGYGFGINANAGRKAVSATNLGKSYGGATYGTYSSSDGSAGTRHGVYGVAIGTGSATAYGIKGSTTTYGSGSQFAIYGETSLVGAGNKYAVFGTSNDTTNSIVYAGFFQGKVYASLLIQGSDRKLKENITASEGVLSKLCKLNPSEYYFKNEYIQAMNLPANEQHGLIADEVEKIFPELVSENVQPARYDSETGEKTAEEITFKGINYTGLIPLVIQSVKEQQSTIEQYKAENELLKSDMVVMKEQITRMENLLNKCCAIEIKETENSYSASLNNGKLEQNNPNPFSSTTEIRYSIPEKANKAILRVYENNFKLLLSYNLTVTLNGLLVIPAGSLPSGEYLYELVIDNQPVDSKKMILTR